ncbi:hypothetical protein IWZ01DRAFT_198723 [Phyllosticta capitalensis]
MRLAMLTMPCRALGGDHGSPCSARAPSLLERSRPRDRPPPAQTSNENCGAVRSLVRDAVTRDEPWPFNLRLRLRPIVGRHSSLDARCPNGPCIRAAPRNWQHGQSCLFQSTMQCQSAVVSTMVGGGGDVKGQQIQRARNMPRCLSVGALKRARREPRSREPAYFG